MAVGRIVGIIGAVAVLGGGGGYFAGGSTRADGEFTVGRGQQTVITWLASAPDDAPVADGATIDGEVRAENNVITAPVLFTDGRHGRVIYTVTPAADNPAHSRVAVELVRDSGWNPVTRFQALTGGGDAPAYAQAAVATAETALGALQADIEPVAYTVETLQPQQFFYIQNYTASEPESINSILRQAQSVIPTLMRSNNLVVVPPGELYAVEPRVEPGRYCYQVGYPYTGTAPAEGSLLVGATGQTPAGTVLRVEYTGTEADVEAQVYDKLDAVLAAARLDATPDDATDDWPTFEVYHDDPTQAGGSRNRTIYYVVPAGVDIERLTALVPPAQPPAPAAPAQAPGEGQQPAAAQPPAQ